MGGRTRERHDIPPVHAMSQASATLMLERLAGGDASASGDLLPLVYDELRSLAAALFRQERAEHTLQPTALVHEAYVRMIAGGEKKWDGRAHFFALAARVMRHVLTDHARKRAAEKRGGDLGRVSLTWAPGGEGGGGASAPADAALDAMALDEALTKLASLNERQAQIVELRFYAGLEVDEVAKVLGVSPRTVDLDWRIARARLRQMLEGR